MSTNRRLMRCKDALRLVVALMMAERLQWFSVTPHTGRIEGPACIVTIDGAEAWPMGDYGVILDEWKEPKE